jgi:hypothetical protein
MLMVLIYLFLMNPIGGFLPSSWGQSIPELKLDASRVSWKRLSFQAQNRQNEVAIQLQLESLPAASVEAALIKSRQGDPIPPSSPIVYKISAIMMVESDYVPDFNVDNQVWFNPVDAAALGRIRLRRGRDDFEKIYRFTRQGVFRHRREPENKKQFSLDPDKWTNLKDTFYPYDLAQLGCPNVSERLVLVYIASAAEISESSPPLSICVFGKRQLHHVKLVPEGLEKLEVDYIEKNQQSEVRRNETVNALKIAFEFQPMKSDLEDDENFSFLGLREDIALFIDPRSNLLIQVVGKMPMVGKVTLKLNEVQLN